jgi:hypothetical protein
MENYKLSILQRTKDQTGWHKSKKFEDAEIAKIKTLDSRSDKSLNAYPTPLARIHLFDDAFNLVLSDERNGTKYSGEAYKKIVSDCLDVFELVYNWNSHIKEGKELEIITWNKEPELDNLKKEYLKNKKVKEKEIKNSDNEEKELILHEIDGYKENLVAETLGLFVNEGIFGKYNEIQIIKFKNKPIAGISPLTGFFTTPNDLNKFGIINPSTKRPYFSKTRLFQDRDAKIRKFIYNFIVHEGTNIFNEDLSISKYLEYHIDLVDDGIPLSVENLKSANNSIFNNSINLKSSKERPIFDYFENTLIRLNFRLNDESFHYPSIHNSVSNSDYLLPLTTAFFEDFDISEISSIVSLNERDDNTVEVKIKKGRKSISKSYQKNILNEVDGQLIDLADTHSIKINLGIFPFIKVMDQDRAENKDYNDFYRLMFVSQDNNFLYGNDDFEIQFGKGKTDIDPDSTLYKIEKEHRTIQKKPTLVGSTYYSTNFCYDYIRINFPNISDLNVCGIIVPKWKEVILGDEKVDFAIDFGTTSTFVALNHDNGEAILPKRFELNEGQIPVALLNKPKDKQPQFRSIDCLEHYSLPDFSEFFEVQKQEFLPSLFNSEKYSFPFRTVVFEKASIPTGQKKTLLNSNIAFAYQREDNNITHQNQVYLPNLKWNIKTKGRYLESIEIFIEELFHLLRLKCILENGNPSKSVISWFSPLSFTSGAKFEYDQLWKSNFKEVFKIDVETQEGEAKQLRNITESEAPFFYYSKIQEDNYGGVKIEDSSSVLTLDIGGGTTDLMYFREDKPVIGSSFYFGANILWGDGDSEFQNEKNNGIYLSVKDKINDVLKSTTLKSLNEGLQKPDSNVGSDEIINFWILNNSESKVLAELNKGEFKLAYLLHFSALIYHSLKLISFKSHPAPSCIIFTGNGSRYLDLIQTKDYIAEICKYYIKELFNDSGNNVQVILPNVNRKEATCFGGLYQQKKQKFDAVTYLGFEEQAETFRKYKEIEVNKDSIFDKLNDSFIEFIELFFKMNETTSLAFRKNFNIESNLAAIKNYMLSKAKVNLITGYNRRKKIAEDSDEITDSLFFYPIVGLIYQINKISKKDISNFIPKTVYYTVSPDDIESFDMSNVSAEKKKDSIFKIEIENSNPDFGEISIIDDPNARSRAKAGLNSFLKSICDFSEFPDNPDQNIEVLKPGIVKKEGNKWVITEKINIQFV